MKVREKYAYVAYSIMIAGVLAGVTSCTSTSTKATTELSSDDPDVPDYFKVELDTLCASLTVAPASDVPQPYDGVYLTWDAVNIRNVVKDEYLLTSSLRYDVYVDDGAGNFANEATAAELMENKYTPTNLVEDASYGWKVSVVIDVDGDTVGDASCTSEVHTFETGESMCANLNAIRLGSGDVHNNYAAFIWDPYEPAEELGIASVWFEFSASDGNGDFDGVNAFAEASEFNSFYTYYSEYVNGTDYDWRISVIADYNGDEYPDVRCSTEASSLHTSGLTMVAHVFPYDFAPYYDFPEEFTIEEDILLMVSDNDFLWDFGGFGLYDGYNDAFDGYPYELHINDEAVDIHNPALAPSFVYTTTDTGYLLSIDAQPVIDPEEAVYDFEHLELSRQFYVSKTNNYARLLYTLSNPTDDDITVDLDFIGNIGSDSDTLIAVTSETGDTVTDDDAWVVTQDSDGVFGGNDDDSDYGDPVLGHLFFGTGGTSHPESSGFLPDGDWPDEIHPLTFNDVTIPSLDQITVVLFVVQGESVSDAQDQVHALFYHVVAGSGDVWYGVSEDVADSVINFSVTNP